MDWYHTSDLSNNRDEVAHIIAPYKTGVVEKNIPAEFSFFSLCFALLITRWFKGVSFIWSNMLQADCEIIELQISPCCLMSTRGSFHPIPAPKKVRARRASHATSFRNTLVLLHPIGRRLPLERREDLGKSQLRLFTSLQHLEINRREDWMTFFVVGVIAFQSLIELYNADTHLGICETTAIHWWLISPPTMQCCHRRVITSHIGKDKPLCLSESASPHRSTFFSFPFFCRNFSRQDRAIYEGSPFLKEPLLTAVSNREGQRGVNGIYWRRSCSGKLELGKLINWDLFCGSQLPRTDCVGAACLGKLPEWRPVIFQSPPKSFSVIFKNIKGPFPRSIHSFWLPTSNKKLYLVKKKNSSFE